MEPQPLNKCGLFEMQLTHHGDQWDNIFGKASPKVIIITGFSSILPYNCWQIPIEPSFHTNFQPLYFNISSFHVYIKSTIFNNPSTLRQSLPSGQSNLNWFAITIIFTGHYSFKSHGASAYCCSSARLFHPWSRKRVPKTHLSWIHYIRCSNTASYTLYWDVLRLISIWT